MHPHSKNTPVRDWEFNTTGYGTNERRNERTNETAYVRLRGRVCKVLCYFFQLCFWLFICSCDKFSAKTAILCIPKPYMAYYIQMGVVQAHTIPNNPKFVPYSFWFGFCFCQSSKVYLYSNSRFFLLRCVCVSIWKNEKNSDLMSTQNDLAFHPTEPFYWFS